MKKLVVLISGRGSNLLALLNAIEAGSLHAEIVAVISNRSEAPGLEFARSRHIPSIVVPSKNRSRADFEAELSAAIEQYSPDWIILAGFMRILGSDTVDRFEGRMFNIHPSLLPKYTGLNTHERVLAAGDQEHGASVHIVTAELDGGPVIGQVKVSVFPDDTVETLSQRVLAQEHTLYVQTMEMCVQENISMKQNCCYVDGKAVSLPLLTLDNRAIET